LPRAHLTPLGEMPGPGLAGFTTLDILVHGWDLAVATGQPAGLDGRLAAHVLGFAGSGRRHRQAPDQPASGSFATEVDLPSPAEEVFRYLTDPAAMIRWMGQHAVLKPVPGGAFEADINGVPVRGQYLEIDPPRLRHARWRPGCPLPLAQRRSATGMP
jgi:hypothetical protein